IETFPDWVMRNGLLVRSARVDYHQYKGKTIRSNFFAQPWSENVSAVIFTNSFTMPKFFRMVTQVDPHPSVASAVRTGHCLLPESNGTFSPIEFEYDVLDPSVPLETWWQGVTVFLNPKAKNPLPEGLLRSTSVFRYGDQGLRREVFDFHPLDSSLCVGLAKET
ncbi:MAG: hypothetical protein L6Q76_26245, partial [Polyangiaceae bacterium]|nr:hypothetical protein [Polyangiaceae bacterium]